jgi:hypothetical protein
MIERESGDDEVIQKLLQEVMKTTAETRSYEATAEKALECLFWMEAKGCKNHSIYMSAVNVVREFFYKAAEEKARIAYSQEIKGSVESTREKEAIQTAALEVYNQSIKENGISESDARVTYFKTLSEKIQGTIDLKYLTWGLDNNVFKYEEIALLEKERSLDCRAIIYYLREHPAITFDQYITTKREAKMPEIRNQITEAKALEEESI